METPETPGAPSPDVPAPDPDEPIPDTDNGDDE